MREAPQVSIVLPTYNRPGDVQETLAQIRANVSVPHEVLVLDNSERPTDMNLCEDERCLFVGRNEGTAARNRGIQRARAPFLLMLDDDSHPLPGSLEAALPALESAPPTVAGLLGNVSRRNGSLESTLLPTTLLGCGVLFRSDVLRRLPYAYPHGFCFYGEEYFVTMALYRDGYTLDACADLKILHRCSDVGRDRETIFYRLGRNNSAVWQKFTPVRYLEQVLYDTIRRYEHIADREGVRTAFDRGLAESLAPEGPVTPLPDDRFRAFSLLDRFEAVAEQCRSHRGVVLCGTGKFPSLWAQALRADGIAHICMSDFNPALIGRSFKDWEVLAPEQAVAAAKHGYKFVTGHASSSDNLRWRQLLAAHQVPSASVFPVMETDIEHHKEPESQAA